MQERRPKEMSWKDGRPERGKSIYIHELEVPSYREDKIIPSYFSRGKRKESSVKTVGARMSQGSRELCSRQPVGCLKIT